MAGLSIVWIWVILAALLCVGELLTSGFFLLPFAVGAGVAALTEIVGGPVWLQIGLFLVVSILCLVLLRPFAKKITKDEPQKSGIDRLIDAEGVVIDEIPAGGTGRIRVFHEEWNATSDDTGIGIERDTRVRILKVEGVHVVVRPIN